ncbi:hypothetical protein QMI71_004167 [Salmonella enterica]|nr:hypothetical protein [Salmonella enterica]
MLAMQPYRVVMKAVSPAVISGIAPSLDGILYEALSQALATDEPEIIHARLREIVLFNNELGVFHTSSLTFGITPEQGVSAVSSIRCDGLNDEKLSSSMFNPRRHGGKFTPLMLKGGPTKQRLTSRPAYTAPYYSFDFFGDRDTVLRLLTTAFVGVGYDFFSAANGEFSETRIIPLDEDSSIDVNGDAMRPVPVTSGLRGVSGFSPLVPPYFYGEREAVIFPEPVRFRLLSELL